MSSAGEVEVEWGGQRFRAVLDGYGGALIVGAALDEKVQKGPAGQGDRTMENENADQNQQQPEEVITTVVDVGTFVETLLQQQEDFKAEIRDEVKKIDELFARQAKAMRDAVDTMIRLTKHRGGGPVN